MPIPEDKLQSWSTQGAVQTSSDTYNSIKDTLESAGAGYASKKFEVFLQGSYRNHTNILTESDVDIVIRLDDTFISETEALGPYQLAAYNAGVQQATYHYSDFKKDVIAVLSTKYGAAVQPGNKAITIAPSGNRRKADVVVALKYEKFFTYVTDENKTSVEGIVFYDKAWTRIVNYPKLHRVNLSAKHQETGDRLKPLVRVFKNVRKHLVDQNIIDKKLAPPYFIEGMLFNVPASQFGQTLTDTFTSSFTWIHGANRSSFWCANKQHLLLGDDVNVSWTAANCDAFLDAVANLWNNWPNSH